MTSTLQLLPFFLDANEKWHSLAHSGDQITPGALLRAERKVFFQSALENKENSYFLTLSENQKPILLVTSLFASYRILYLISWDVPPFALYSLLKQTYSHLVILDPFFEKAVSSVPYCEEESGTLLPALIKIFSVFEPLSLTEIPNTVNSYRLFRNLLFNLSSLFDIKVGCRPQFIHRISELLLFDEKLLSLTTLLLFTAAQDFSECARIFAYYRVDDGIPTFYFVFPIASDDFYSSDLYQILSSLHRSSAFPFTAYSASHGNLSIRDKDLVGSCLENSELTDHLLLAFTPTHFHTAQSYARSPIAKLPDGFFMEQPDPISPTRKRENL